MLTEVPDPSRRTTRLVGLAVLVLTVLAFVRVPLLPDLGAELHMSPAQLGAVTTVFAVGRVVADLPAGWLAQTVPAPPVMAGSALLLGAASLGMATAPSMWVVMLAALVLGVASATVNTSGMAHFAESAPTQRRGRALAGFSAAMLTGQAMGPALGGAVAAASGWRGALVAAAGLSVVVGVCVALLSRRDRRPRHRPPRTAPRATAPRTSATRRELVILHLVSFAMFFTLGSMPQTLLPIIGADAFELDAGTIGLALGVGGACRLVGALVGGSISDRVSRKSAMVPALALQGAGVALLALEDRLWAWLAAIVVMSVASFGMSVAATMLVDHAGGRRTGAQLGPFRLVGDVGLILGPVVTTLVFETAGQAAAALLVAVLLVVTALASAAGLRETGAPRP